MKISCWFNGGYTVIYYGCVVHTVALTIFIVTKVHSSCNNNVVHFH